MNFSHNFAFPILRRTNPRRGSIQRGAQTKENTKMEKYYLMEEEEKLCKKNKKGLEEFLVVFLSTYKLLMAIATQWITVQVDLSA